MSAGPKLKFGSDQQDVTRDGERKWSVQVAVSYFADYGMRPQAEVIEVGLTGEDPEARPARYAGAVRPAALRRVRS